MNNKFYIDTQGNDDNSYEMALKFAISLLKSDDSIKKIFFLISSKRNTGWLDRIYGIDVVKKLFNGINQNGVLLKIETIRTLQNNYSKATDIVIACGLSSDEIFKIEDYKNVKYIIAIPWLKELTQSWININQPSLLVINDNVITISSEENILTPSLITQEALKELTAVINTSTGISHPSDNSRAKTFIRTLFKYEPELNSDLICSYLVNELSWQTKYSNDIRKLIDTLNSGKYFTGGEKTGLQNHYKRWKKAII